MATEQMQQFLQAIRQDGSLQERMRTAPDQASIARLAVELGAEHGYHFTATEVEEWMGEHTAAVGELSDRELDQVSGGGGWPQPTSVLVNAYGGC